MTPLGLLFYRNKAVQVEGGPGGDVIQCQEIGLIDLKQAFGLYLFFAEGLNTHENTHIKM